MTFNVDKEKVKKCISLVTDSTRKGIVKSNYNGDFGTVLNLEELNYLYDHFHQTANDLTPELFPSLNGNMDIEKSKEFWAEHWENLFGSNGEHWGKDFSKLRDVKGLYQ